MRSPKGWGCQQTGTRGQEPRDRMNGGRLERFVKGERRQDAGQAPGQHALARTGRADEQQVVAAGGGNFDRASGERLAAHVCQVGGGIACRRGRWRGGRRARLTPGQDRRGFLERGDRDHLEPGDDCRFARVGPGQDDAPHAIATGSGRDREGAPDRPDRTVERQLAEHHRVVDLARRDHPDSREHPDRDREIEGRSDLPDVGRGEVHRHAALRELEAGVPDGALHAVAALAYAGVRQPHHGDRGQPSVRDVDLDTHRVRVDAEDGGGPHDGSTVACAANGRPTPPPTKTRLERRRCGGMFHTWTTGRSQQQPRGLRVGGLNPRAAAVPRALRA